MRAVDNGKQLHAPAAMSGACPNVVEEAVRPILIIAVQGKLALYEIQVTSRLSLIDKSRCLRFVFCDCHPSTISVPMRLC